MIKEVSPLMCEHIDFFRMKDGESVQIEAQ